MGLNVPSPDLAGAADPYFLSINDRPADKGFLVTTADELINWARTGSLMWMTSPASHAFAYPNRPSALSPKCIQFDFCHTIQNAKTDFFVRNCRIGHLGIVTTIQACGFAGVSLAKRMNKISYKGYRFPPEIIQHAIWLYLRFTLSFRDVEDLLAERGIQITMDQLEWFPS
jgi:hypothetical protein